MPRKQTHEEFVQDIKNINPTLYFYNRKISENELLQPKKDNKITEGPTVTINYVSGTSGRIQQMALAKKCMKSSSKINVRNSLM